MSEVYKIPKSLEEVNVISKKLKKLESCLDDVVGLGLMNEYEKTHMERRIDKKILYCKKLRKSFRV